MNVTVETTLKGIRLGEIQTFHNLAAFPILGNGTAGPDYITMGSALQKGILKIEEVSESGSVPDVRVINSGEVAVLLLDGEELAGAKQNRVLNTTVLLKAMSKTVINVSCTERGRWSYATREFMDSDVMMARNIRAMKNRSVSASLNQSHEFFSDQVEIWDEIDALCASAGVCSETDAMRDVFEDKKNELNDCLEAFPKVENQRGLVFLIDRAVVGLDLVSRPEAYSELHSKLLRSYVIDSMPRNDEDPRLPSPDVVHQFIGQVLGCSEASFPSVGLGSDLRYEGREVCGSALVCEDTCVHAAFFSNVPFKDGPRMRGFRQRRGFRQ
ncbi:MAG TPA: hypothetical protein P5318_12245 [Candidatus Hydrogenedentes bacterium]|nr:hypothetical protein [Candidatus Hydrogenedentota bacterium]HPC16972.1 hypothetical protein [Candidatus Hydrogenedentota bacterium]HRT20889.1 hypothetical protein [Candidatus Hydrogenedentota bacterium]HRT66233.1 hypothetical protein [Candidatus Hydrogenedentota bacterium]